MLFGHRLIPLPQSADSTDLVSCSMVAPFGPDLVREHHSLMSSQHSSRMVNTSRTVGQKRLRGSVIIPFATPVPGLVPAEGYVGVVTTSFNPIDLGYPDVHCKHDGECR